MRHNKLVKRRLEPMINEFKRNLSPDEFILYSLTLLPDAEYVKSSVSFTDLDARDCLAVDSFKYLDHRLMQRAIPTKYTRAIHQPRRTRSLLFVEHESKSLNLVSTNDPLEPKTPYQLTTPHVHAIVAIHKSCEEKILECFAPNVSAPSELCLKPDAFKENSFKEFFKNMTHVKMKLIDNLDNIANYCAKEFVYKADYLDHARVYKHAY